MFDAVVFHGLLNVLLPSWYSNDRADTMRACNSLASGVLASDRVYLFFQSDILDTDTGMVYVTISPIFTCLAKTSQEAGL